MRRLFSLLALGTVAIATGLIEPAQVVIGDWTVLMDKDCTITVSHPLNQEAWVSDKEIIQVGTGNVDVVNIIKNGDIQNFPEAVTYSRGLTCQQVSSLSGVFQAKGTVNVPSNTTEPRVITYALSIEKVQYSKKQLKIKVTVDDASINDFNFIQLNFKSN